MLFRKPIASILLFPLLYWLSPAANAQNNVLQQLMDGVLYASKGVAERIAAQQPQLLPPISYQLDAPTSNALDAIGDVLNTCPPCQETPSLAGTWQISHVSRRFLSTTAAQLERAISALASGQPAPPPNPLNALFSRELDVQCAQLTFLDDNVSTPIEWSYTLSSYDSAPSSGRSIIGSSARIRRRAFRTALAPGVSADFCVLASQLSPGEEKAGFPSASVLLLGQLDVFPKCDNILVLERRTAVSTQNYSQDGDLAAVRQILSAYATRTPLNPLRSLRCEASQPAAQTGPIVPVPVIPATTAAPSQQRGAQQRTSPSSSSSSPFTSVMTPAGPEEVTYQKPDERPERSTLTSSFQNSSLPALSSSTTATPGMLALQQQSNQTYAHDPLVPSATSAKTTIVETTTSTERDEE